MAANTPATKEMSWDDQLTQLTAENLLKRKYQKTLFVFAEDTLGQVLQNMAEHKVLSAAVINKSDQAFRGFVDMLDVVAFTVQEWRDQKWHFILTPVRARFRGRVLDQPVWKILNFSAVNEPVVVPKNTSVRELLNVFTDPHYHGHLHRVAVRDDDGKVYESVSQWDLLQLVAREGEDQHLPSGTQRTVEELGLDTLHAVVSASHQSTLRQLLEVLSRNRVSAVAMVDEYGVISGVLSANELRGLQERDFEFFDRPVMQYKQVALDGMKGLVTCKSNTKLCDVIRQLLRTKVHRVFVLDDMNRPRAVIGTNDVLSMLRHCDDLEASNKAFQVPKEHAQLMPGV